MTPMLQMIRPVDKWVVPEIVLPPGYDDIYLLTDDHRLPAIKTYLRIGFVPFLFGSGMEERWRSACEKLGWPVDFQSWTGKEHG